MTIHVPIGEAKRRLPELVAAVVRGEEVLLDSPGAPQMRLVLAASNGTDDIDRRAARRRSAIGMFADRAGGRDIDVAALKSDARWDDHYERKFGHID